MKHRGIYLSFGLLLFLFLLIAPVYARSGCCSSHGGVNCAAGPQPNGRVICNDGWRGSSCSYSGMVKCRGYSFESTPPPPVVPKTHRVCQNGNCVEVTGEGADECYADSSCWHKECQSGKCVVVNQPGTDSCTLDSECSHKECREGKCAAVPGAGQDLCSTDSVCIHYECIEGICTEVASPGESACSTDRECCHLECVEESCKCVPGAEEDTCQDDSGCRQEGEVAGEATASPEVSEEDKEEEKDEEKASTTEGLLGLGALATIIGVPVFRFLKDRKG